MNAKIKEIINFLSFKTSRATSYYPNTSITVGQSQSHSRKHITTYMYAVTSTHQDNFIYEDLVSSNFYVSSR
jgi:hypothetical protein